MPSDPGNMPPPQSPATEEEVASLIKALTQHPESNQHIQTVHKLVNRQIMMTYRPA